MLNLKYRSMKHSFAIPFRSNIPSYTPKENYFGMPKTSKTRDRHVSALHFIKMFPVKKEYLLPFRVTGNAYYEMVESYVRTHLPQIVKEAQRYLGLYESGNRPAYCTDIDGLFMKLYGFESMTEVATALQKR